MTLIIFDADGTLRRPLSNKIAPSSPDDWEFMPGVVEWFDANRPQRWGIASNQGGVSCGYVSEADALAAIRNLANALCLICNINEAPVKIETSLDLENPRRKPNPGMLMELMEFFGSSPNETIMVGDRDEDELAALAAGCRFVHRDVFFMRPGAVLASLRKTETKKCPMCGKEFTARATATTCSATCRSRLFQKTKKERRQS
jgi:HAD superfamily hydrolase (TIGR01662 family)